MQEDKLIIFSDELVFCNKVVIFYSSSVFRSVTKIEIYFVVNLIIIIKYKDDIREKKKNKKE